MAMTLDIPQTVSPVDALWTLICSQKKTVQVALAKRLNDVLLAKEPIVATMTLEEVNARFDQAENDIKSGNVMSCEDVHRSIQNKCSWL